MSVTVIQRRLDKKTAKAIDLQRQLESLEAKLNIRSKLVAKLQHAPESLEKLKIQVEQEKRQLQEKVESLSNENALLRTIQTKLKLKWTEVEASESQGQNLVELQEAILDLNDKLETYKSQLRDDQENLGGLTEARALQMRDGLLSRLSSLKSTQDTMTKEKTYWKNRFMQESEETVRVMKASESIEQENRMLEQELACLEIDPVQSTDTKLEPLSPKSQTNLQKLKSHTTRLHAALQTVIAKYESHQGNLKVLRGKQLVTFREYSHTVEKVKASENMKLSDFNYLHRRPKKDRVSGEVDEPKF